MTTKNILKRRTLLSIPLALAPIMVVHAEYKPLIKSTATPLPPKITPMEENAYRTRVFEILTAILTASNKVQTKAIEAMKYPANARQPKWVSDYVDQALTVGNGATEMFTLDPPSSLALPHVYLLRYCNAIHEAINQYNAAIDARNTSDILKAQDTAAYAKSEFQKAMILFPK